MQSDLISTGSHLIQTRLPDINATCSHFESGISFKPVSSESRDSQLRYSQFASNSPTNSIHNGPLASYSRRREPNEAQAQTTCKTERSANLRRRFPFFNKQNQGREPPRSDSNTTGTWQPFPLDTLTGLRRNLTDTEKKKLSKTTIEYYRKQSLWVDELIEVDRLLRTTPTITKAPPLPNGSASASAATAPATTTEMETETEAETVALLAGGEHEAALEQDKSDSRTTSVAVHAERSDGLRASASATTSTAKADSLELLSPPTATPRVDIVSASPDGAAEAAVPGDRGETPATNQREIAIASAPPAATVHPQGRGDVERNGQQQLRHEADRQSIIATRVAKLLLCINLVLLFCKLAAVILSGSLAVVAVLVDNAVDMASGIVVWVSNVAIRRRNIYHYPQGRKRLEPVGIVILAAIMAVASGQVILESVTKLVQMITENAPGPVMTWVPIGLLIGDLITKTTLFFVMFRFRKGNHSIQALQMDMRNDMISNVGSLVSGLIAYHFLKYVDPITAILIAVYIAFSWSRQLLRQARLLTGYTAPKEFLNTLTWIAASHDPRILEVDTVRAFHAGVEYFVEVDVVLPADMMLIETHDIGESLQQKIELLPNVARAFVHLDYESRHNPDIEHKVN